MMEVSGNNPRVPAGEWVQAALYSADHPQEWKGEDRPPMRVGGSPTATLREAHPRPHAGGWRADTAPGGVAGRARLPWWEAGRRGTRAVVTQVCTDGR